MGFDIQIRSVYDVHMSFLSHLECGLCGQELESDRLWNLCPQCGRPLLARYDLEKARGQSVALSRAAPGARPAPRVVPR
jgi:predicted amidophosphoribosyltransferase